MGSDTQGRSADSSQWLVGAVIGQGASNPLTPSSSVPGCDLPSLALLSTQLSQLEAVTSLLCYQCLLLRLTPVPEEGFLQVMTTCTCPWFFLTRSLLLPHKLSSSTEEGTDVGLVAALLNPN